MAFAGIVELIQNGLQTLLQILILILPQDFNFSKQGNMIFIFIAPPAVVFWKTVNVKTVKDQCYQSFEKYKLIKNGNYFFTLSTCKKKQQSPFFRLCINDMKILGLSSFEWCLKGKIIKSYIYAINCSCDSVAQTVLQNIKQFKGKFGCYWCLHPGKKKLWNVKVMSKYILIWKKWQNVVTDMVECGRNVAVGETFVLKGPTTLKSLQFLTLSLGLL